MSMKRLADGLHILPGTVNMYLIEAPEGLTLVDAGFPGNDRKVLDALRSLGRSPSDLKHIVLTHAHYDHVGGAAALKRATGARTYMHPADIPMAAEGRGLRPMTRAPGLLPLILFPLVAKSDARTDPVVIDQPIADGDVLPIGGGLRVIHVPGHCAGQVTLLWTDRGVLFAADACSHLLGLGPPVGYEDRALGEASQRKLAGLEFETACFGHGRPIMAGASGQFRRAFG